MTFEPCIDLRALLVWCLTITTDLLAQVRPTPRPVLLRSAGEEIAAHHLSEAESILTTILREAPGEARAQERLGIVRFQQGDAPAAESLFRGAIQSQPELASAHANLGSLLEKYRPA